MKQLPLDLPDDDDAKTAVTWRYDYSPRSLVEEVGDLRYVYGSWEHLFGCWQKKGTDSSTRTDGSTRTGSSLRTGSSTREVIPHWPLMDENGVWKGSDVSFRMRFPEMNVRRSVKWHRHERAAFIAFISSIPRPVRSLVAPFGQYSWLLLDMIWQVPRFSRFLDQEIRANGGQFVVAVIALSGASRLSRKHRADLVRKIMSTKRKTLIGEIGHVSQGGRFIKILRRLGNTYHGPEFYHELAAVMNCPRRSHLLSHEKNPKREIIFALTHIPDELLATPVIGLVGRSWRSYTLLKNLNQMMEAAPASVRDRILDAFRSVRTVEDAWRMILRWEKRLLEYISFPEPPLPAHNQLTPLSNPDAMRQEAHAMHNCLTDLIGDVAAGGVFYYHWDGPEPATVRVRNRNHSAGGQWNFVDAAGFRNGKLPPDLSRYLKSLINSLALEEVSASGKDPPSLIPLLNQEEAGKPEDTFNSVNSKEMKK